MNVHTSVFESVLLQVAGRGKRTALGIQSTPPWWVVGIELRSVGFVSSPSLCSAIWCVPIESLSSVHDALGLSPSSAKIWNIKDQQVKDSKDVPSLSSAGEVT